MKRFALALTALLGIQACASVPTVSPAPGPAGGAGAATYGVIVSLRPLAAASGGVRTAILDAVGEPAGEAAGQGAPGCEFIIREDSGQTLSVVQNNDAGLRPGERVVLTMGVRTRLSRVAD